MLALHWLSNGPVKVKVNKQSEFDSDEKKIQKMMKKLMLMMSSTDHKSPY